MSRLATIIDSVALPALRLPIAGLDAADHRAFPGRRACVIYLQGCPLRCGYCENPQMTTPRRGSAREWETIHRFLAERREGLEAVVFSGGEPTLHAGLDAAVAEVKALGLAVGLHTAGPYPERLAALLPHLDWVALDVKGRGRDFDRVCGRTGIWRRHVRSLEMLLASGVAHECRTTVHWQDFGLADLERLALTLADCGVRRYVLQPARTDQCLDPEYCRPVPGAPSLAALDALVRRLRPHFTHIELRH
ncbi:anaerobic ribonucleoside-triphosphate reductase activating protein [Halomonas heilongjiangensis]|uniref:Anaerobic ribonucleoside-triphosphate reductase activating protein n=1 Tax=Halomonas heilongjiangensis TaxID=1387883 RepID=A0A2N7TMV0_9GAMM|nr:anaerobic ribonucleoside-triphosphate reductase activating protein [Halomonas heilongjiangensis]PMR69516.1 anaerobic ribonucleoside-triphosphate reductase activating protein [Halomonas heilongjiangensis]PXX92852.1 anaerobic ribonucleoside-triphosphate reductase activating protein [Halomonas heilongjiangensis]